MSQKLQSVRGTHDLFFEDAEKFSAIIEAARKEGALYGFKEIQTPIFEFTEVFKRTLGETSDVVNKEMYTFEDRGGDSITLRPEFTAGIARAFISNGLQQNLPLKLFCAGPLFRYERPQKGRQRQFHQVNFEWLGEREPYADVEMIALASGLLKSLGIVQVKLNINSLGDKESRESYRNKLIEYLSDFKHDLSEDSKNRLEKNPMRILDSKDDGDRKIIAGAPIIKESLNAESTDFFAKIKEGLKVLNIDFTENHKIVRGLDYYNHMVFEFISESGEMGAQNTILAGGRYDGLIAQMGGPETPAVGFAGGIERLMLTAKLEKEKKSNITLVLPIGDEATNWALKVANELRKSFEKCEIIYGNNLKKKMQKADKMGADFAIIIGDNELRERVYTYKNLRTGEEEKRSLKE